MPAFGWTVPAPISNSAAAHLEGFARPLWGLAPLGAGKGDFAHWHRFAEGLANGTDPDHPEYWGTVYGRDQRMVELAALGFALALVPDKIWEPLGDRARANVVAYLKHARQFDYADNNWKFFRIFVDIALDRVGAEFDRSLTKQYLEELEGFYAAMAGIATGMSRPASTTTFPSLCISTG